MPEAFLLLTVATPAMFLSTVTFADGPADAATDPISPPNYWLDKAAAEAKVQSAPIRI